MTEGPRRARADEAAVAQAPRHSHPGGALTRTQLQAVLKPAGRTRGIEAEAHRIHDVFRADRTHQPPLMEDALGKQMLALLIQLEAARTAADDIAKAVEEAFPQHPDAEILLSFPGPGRGVGADLPGDRYRPGGAPTKVAGRARTRGDRFLRQRRSFSTARGKAS
ncbi:hypothetical protein [Streptomyces halobius]|uniref:Uncharacterized protein n=1 Tax=Streptomyces halobius TaxID=2879846 RepID=A0ABY4MLY9_9ACTN|nr:hypothetical protein [Streptomyces halobius]UQA97436.1 hypothetical protein K9S39_41250 [Streptomyces halobius]